MAKVTGIGGVFFKSNDPKKLTQWYQQHLGVPVDDYGYVSFPNPDQTEVNKESSTVWSPFKNDTTYFHPSDLPYMINFRVDDLVPFYQLFTCHGKCFKTFNRHVSQIFIAFAVFLLVKKFGFTIQSITLLFLANNIINFFINPLIGKFIVKYGERKLLSIEYFFLVLIFIAYAFVESKIVVGILYIFDHIFFNFSTGIQTYFQKIADPEDIAPSAAVGFTINHIAAVILPVIGGILWMVDYKIPFLFGAFFSFISLCLVQYIKTE